MALNGGLESAVPCRRCRRALGFLGHDSACSSKRNEGGDFARVLFVDATELLAQKFFFAADADDGADTVNN